MSRSGAAYLSTGAGLGTIPLVTGNHYHSQHVTTLSTVSNPADGTARFVPFWIPNPAGVTLTGIACETVTTAAASGGLIRLGVYASGANGLPGALVIDAGTVDSTVTPGVLEITISQAVGPGVYWLVAVPQGTPATAATMRTGSVGLSVVGKTAADTTIVVATFAAGVTGALPGTAPSVAGTNPAFQVFVKV